MRTVLGVLRAQRGGLACVPPTWGGAQCPGISWGWRSSQLLSVSSVKDKEDTQVDSEARPMKDETFGEYR